MIPGIETHRISLALITPKVVGTDGQGRVNLEVIRRLRLRIDQITIVTMDADKELSEYSNVSLVRIPVEWIRFRPLRYAAFSLLSFAWLRRNRRRYSIVQVDGASTIAASDLNASHFVHAAWRRSPAHPSRLDRGIFGLYHRLLSWMNEIQERAAYRRAKLVVAVSNAVRRDLLALGVPSDVVRVIPLGVDSKKFSVGESERSKFGLPPTVFLAMFAGDLKTPRKNLVTVLEALALAPGVHLVVVGTNKAGSFSAAIRRLGLADRITFLGFRKDIAQVMRACDAFVFPSRYEPFGLVVLEAMASGLPVVTARATGASDVVTKDCGFVLEDACDAVGLARALNAMANNPALHRKLADAARQRSLEFSWDAVAENFAKVIDEVLALKQISGSTKQSE